jgi:hypothetical protein
MGESGVNEQSLNAVLSSLANLASAGQESWFNGDVVSTDFADRHWAALEALRTDINQLTQILIEVLKVENLQHKESFNFRLGQCMSEELLHKLNRTVIALREGLVNAPTSDQWDLLRHGKMWLSEWYDEAIPSIYQEIRSKIFDNPKTYIYDFSDFLQNQIMKEQFDSISRIERSARTKLDHINTASGAIGAKSLAEGFSTQTDKEATRAAQWTIGVVASVALGIALPVLALTTERVVFSTTVDPTVGTIIKALTGLPLFALAAYFGRIASQHRETERYLRILTTQMNTVQAYADVLPQPERGQLIHGLGLRAFADPGFTTTDKGKVSAVPEDVAELLKKAMDVAKGSKP